MTNGAFNETEWMQQLIAEAKRDVVFAFNIAAGAFGGPRPPVANDVPILLERVAAALVEAGCVVGFGSPDTNKWVVPERLQVAPEHLASSIGRFYAEDPSEAKFLVFAHRAELRRSADA